MKNKLNVLLVFALILTLSLSGCKISVGSPTVLNEVSKKNIVSMALDKAGTLFILADGELTSYALSGDKKLDTVFDRQALAEAELEVNNIGGDSIVYSGFIPEKLISCGEDGFQFVGRYSANDLEHQEDMFVIQDMGDMNFTAAYLGEIRRDYGAGTKTVNGIAVTDTGVYLRLNRDYIKRDEFNGGVNYNYNGYIDAFPMPDGVVGAIETGDGGETVHFLLNGGDGCRLECGGTEEAVFDRAPVADAFVQDGKVYVIYTDGIVTEYSER